MSCNSCRVRRGNDTSSYTLPLNPWQGLGVVALWTTGALLLGALVLQFRDA
jgi:hypothetical protein